MDKDNNKAYIKSFMGRFNVWADGKIVYSHRNYDKALKTLEMINRTNQN